MQNNALEIEGESLLGRGAPLLALPKDELQLGRVAPHSTHFCPPLPRESYLPQPVVRHAQVICMASARLMPTKSDR